jgi:hypothetical protein
MTAEYEQARDARARMAHGYCEVSWDDACRRVGVHAHHVRSRARGGSDQLENLRWVCWYCHAQVHNYPAEAEARGWLLHSWDPEP